MARYGTRADAEVNKYLDSIRRDRWEQGGGEGGGVYVRGWAPSPYIMPGEDPDDPAVRARIAERLGVQNPEGQVEYPDETEDPIAPWVMAAMMAFAGGAAGGMGAGAASTSSTPTWMQPTAGGVADTGWGASTLNGSVMGPGADAGVNAAGVTTGAGATASGMPSWLTPGAAFSGIGAAATLANLGGGGDSSGNAAWAAPAAGPNYGQFGSSVYDMANQTSNIAGIGPQTSSIDPYGLGWTDQSGQWGANIAPASSGWSLPGNLGKLFDGTASAGDWGNAVGGLAGIGSGIYGMTQANSLKNPIDFTGGAPSNIDFTAGNLDFSKLLPTAGTMDFSAADPWGTSGGRDVAGAKLKGLLNDPSALYSMPGWQAGQEAVQRSMAAQGYTGSGNMLAALQKYGGDYYNQALQQLTTLSGGAQDPSTISKLQLSQQGQNQQQQQAAAQLQLSQLNQDSQLALQQRGQNQQLQLGGAQLNTQREIAGNTLASQSLASLGYGGQRLLGGQQQQQMDPKAFSQMMSIYNMGRGMI